MSKQNSIDDKNRWGKVIDSLPSSSWFWGGAPLYSLAFRAFSAVSTSLNASLNWVVKRKHLSCYYINSEETGYTFIWLGPYWLIMLLRIRFLLSSSFLLLMLAWELGGETAWPICVIDWNRSLADLLKRDTPSRVWLRSDCSEYWGYYFLLRDFTAFTRPELRFRSLPMSISDPKPSGLIIAANNNIYATFIFIVVGINISKILIMF